MNLPARTSERPPSPAGGAVPSEGGEFVLSSAVLVRAVRKGWVLLVLGIVLGLAGATLYTARQVRVYEALATVQFDPQSLLPLGNQGRLESGPDSYWSNQEYFATQHQVITSRRVTAAVVRRLGLNHDPGFIEGVPARKDLPAVTKTVDETAEILRARLIVKPVTDSRLARIMYRDADPDRARRILDAVVDVYVDQNLELTLDSANKRAAWLDTQMGTLKGELETQEMDLHDFKKRNNLLSVSFDDQSNMLRAQIQQLNTSLTELKTRQERVAARLGVLKQIDPEDPATIPQSELLGNAVLDPLRAGYLQAKNDLDRLIAVGKGENHPDVQAARGKVRSIREALNVELKNIRAGAAADLQAVHHELEGVTTLYETAKAQAMELNLNEVRYGRLRRSKDNTEHIFGLVLERSTESNLSKLMPFNNVRVLDRPLKPNAPVLPRPVMNLAFGAIFGLVLGLAGALVRETLDRTVRDAEDAERELGFASLGSLPDVSGRSARASHYYRHHQNAEDGRDSRSPRPDELTRPELLVHTHPKSAMAEAARAVRTNLVFMSPDRPYKSLLVTSAGPAEGKTMVAASMAIAMSQAGQRVCLVDCDLRRPRVHQVFQQTLERGVTTALLDLNKLDEALIQTEVPNLWVLPAGPMPPNPADLMHSEAFGRLSRLLSERFDRVVVDSPPVCVVTDAVILSTRVDATMLVVRARKTKREGARRAVRAIRDVGGSLTGFVMNAIVPSGDTYAYSYYNTYARRSGEAGS
jgi:succinoglycan biosynthesis transport protein ExoP